MSKRILSSLGVLIFITAPLLAGTKEELIRLQNDILQLQKQVLNLQKKFDDNNGMVISLLEQLNDQSATTNRLLEQLGSAVRAQKEAESQTRTEMLGQMQDMGLQIQDTNTRLGALHQKIEESQMRVENRRVPAFAQTSGTKPDQVYNLAFTDFLEGNFELAISAFQDFLANYPSTEFADNAAYYLGICYQQLGQPESAIAAFDQVINIYPGGDMAASAYYKKAATQQDLQKNQEAVETYRKLISLFPDSVEADTARQRLEEMGVEIPKTTRRRL